MPLWLFFKQQVDRSFGLIICGAAASLLTGRCSIWGVASSTSPWELAHRKLFPITTIAQVKRGLRSLGKELEIAPAGSSDVTAKLQLSTVFWTSFGLQSAAA